MGMNDRRYNILYTSLNEKVSHFSPNVSQCRRERKSWPFHVTIAIINFNNVHHNSAVRYVVTIFSRCTQRFAEEDSLLRIIESIKKNLHKYRIKNSTMLQQLKLYNVMFAQKHKILFVSLGSYKKLYTTK